MLPASALRWSMVVAVLVMVVWGANFPITKYILERVGVGCFLFFRFLLLPLVGFALLAFIYRKRWRYAVPKRDDWARFAACGIVGHAMHVGIVMWGMNLSTPFSSALVLTSGPLWTLLILAALGTEKLRGPQVTGTLLAFGGILLFLSDKFTAGHARAGLGDVVLLFAASLFSLYTIMVRPLVTRYGPLMVLVWTLVVAAPPMLLISLPAALALDYAAVTPLTWWWLFWAITVSSFLGWLGWAWVNAVRGIARSAPLQYMMPPLAAVFSWITLGESFTWLKLVGALVVMVGVAWAQFASSPTARNTTQADSG